MSSSEAAVPNVAQASERLRDAVAVATKLSDSEDGPALDRELVDALVTATVRLYYRSCSSAGHVLALKQEGVSPSEALTLVDSLLAAQDLSTFDLALWLSRTRGDG